MAQIEEGKERLAAAGITPVAISYDSVDILNRFAERPVRNRDLKITFPILSDEDSATIRAYGIFNELSRPGTRDWGIPHPGTYILDEKGVVRAKIFREGYLVRHEVDELLEAAGKID